MIFLPYAEEIRSTKSVEAQIPAGEAVEPDRQQVIAAKKMINALTVSFDPNNFENPNLQSMYSYLQALALNEPEPEPIKDLLQPDYEGMKKVQSLVVNFRDLCFGEDYVDPEERVDVNAKLQKRKRDPQEEAEEDKKVLKAVAKGKKEGSSIEEQLSDAEKLIKAGQAAKLTVAQLRAFLESKSLDTQGNKNELIQRAKDAIYNP